MLKRVTICTLVAMSSATLLATPAQAQDISKEQLAECASITNALKRLVCFDELAANANVAVTTKSTETAQKQSAVQRNDNFGKEHKVIEQNSEGRQTIAIKSRKKNLRGLWIIETESGQTWQQAEADTFLFKEGAQYYIERGVFNSFYLSHDGTNRRLKVRRID